jgi:hypothetical protein
MRMKRSDLQEYFKNGRVIVDGRTFAIVKSDRAFAGAFAVIRDTRETTCVVEEQVLGFRNVIGIDRGWRLVTFDMILPFGLVGFIAQVSGALAKEGISILSFSAYSTDHVFVKNKDLEKAVGALRKLGFIVTRQ